MYRAGGTQSEARGQEEEKIEKATKDNNNLQQLAMFSIEVTDIPGQENIFNRVNVFNNTNNSFKSEICNI